MSHAVDLQLAQHASRGQTESQRQLAERLFPCVSTTVRYLVAGHAHADDFVQQALIEILRSTHTYRGEASLESWSNRITVRTTLRLLRHERAKEQRQRDVSEQFAPGARSRRDTWRPFVRGRIRDALDHLPVEQRAVVVLRFVHGYSVGEIARMTDALPNTVADRLRKGKARLKKALSRDADLQRWAEQGCP